MDAFVPTTHARIAQLLTLANVGPGDRLVDLGSGDGRVLAAAEALGATAVGIEADADRAATSAGTVIIGDVWQQDWTPYSVVFAAVSAQYREPMVTRWRALQHRAGDRLILLADSTYAEVHLAAAD